MAVDQAPSRVPARSRDDAKIVQYHDFIDEKIDSTRRMVKLVDLATALVELLVSVLLFLLLTIVAEHWVVPGGLPSAVRVILFLILAAGCGYFAIRRLWPLCVRAINPVYAAQTIEHASPALKNGLINLLLFRERRTEISDAVYRTLEEQAAHGLTRVPVDTAVDRTELIRLGYVLIGIVAVAGLYKVFSPKDPFVAAERVLMPWSNVLPASRVTISDIKPGTEIISQGEVVEVSADVHGLNDDDTVVVRYSTEDGQIVGRAIPLKASADKLRFQARLADEAERGLGGGVTRNLKYHLEAGDARSLTYSLTVVPAATILVERVDYHYPKYTGLLDQSVDGVGDIRAIEGTRVTIHARANGAIREANVDFDADGRPDLQMATEESKAHAEFQLGLRDDRQTPQHASYVLRFANAEGRANHDPVKYSINVDPDRQPEAEIRVPQEKSRDARLDETVNIEIEARDPDFALSAVRLRGEVSGREVLGESLLKEEHHGPFSGRFALAPAARGLKEGDVLEYWAEADDNRTPKPNTVATEHKTLRIVSANPAQQPPQDRMAKNDRQQPQNGGQGQKNQQQKGEQNQKNQQGQSGDQQTGGQSKQREQNQGGQGQQGQGQGDKQQGDKQQGDKAQPGQSNGEQQSGGGDQKQSGDLKQNQTGAGQGDKANQHNGQGQGQGGGQSVSNDPSSNKPDQQGENKQTGAGAAGGERSKDGAQPDGARPDASKSENSGGGKSNSGDQKTGQQQKGQQADPQSGEAHSPVSSEGDDDAEAFNRIQKRMEQSGELKPSENSKKDEPQADKGQHGESKGAGKENSSAGQPSQSGEDKAGTRNGQSQPKDGASSKNSDSQQSPGEGSKAEEKGKGAQSRKDDSGQQEKQGGDSQQQHSPGGEQSSAKGSAGGGNDGKKQGSPNSQPGMKPTEKPEQAGSKGDKKGDQEPPAGANGKKESDSHGDQGGDKAGGGSEGGGQKSPHDGTGSSGENQSADTGNGKSGEQGKGETSSASGKDAKSDHPTGGTDGKTQGKGSEQRDGAGDKAGGQKGEQQGAGGNKPKQGKDSQSDEGLKQSQGDKRGQKQEANKSEGKGADQQAGKNDTGRSEKPSDQKSDRQQNGKDDGANSRGGSGSSGEPGGAVNPQVSITGEAPEGDAANLEYARKQTDLVVNKLADQLNRKRVDDGLLKDLGWSEADLKHFVDRWQQRKAAAEQGNEAGDAAKRELDDALRSLGLRPGELQQSAAQKDSMRDLHEGYRGPVPAEYKDRLRAYNQGVSRARRDGE